MVQFFGYLWPFDVTLLWYVPLPHPIAFFMNLVKSLVPIRALRLCIWSFLTTVAIQSSTQCCRTSNITLYGSIDGLSRKETWCHRITYSGTNANLVLPTMVLTTFFILVLSSSSIKHTERSFSSITWRPSKLFVVSRILYWCNLSSLQAANISKSFYQL